MVRPRPMWPGFFIFALGMRYALVVGHIAQTVILALVPAPLLRFFTALALRLLSLLPLAWNRAIGAGIGRLAWHLSASMRSITRTNLHLCYPNLSDQERESLAHESMIETGRALTESAWVWLRSPDTLQKKASIIAGESLYRDALAAPEGLLLATPHIGNWEASNIVVARHEPLTYLYRAPRAEWMEPLVLRWRANFDNQAARLDAGGIRQVLQALRQGKVVGVLPDQEPDRASGVLAPLFGQQAHTMTLLQKLGRRGKAKVLFCVCARKPGGKGWALSFLEPEKDILHEDSVIAAAAMNKTIERCIELYPAQYLWSYKRFNLLPDGARRNYKNFS